MVFSILRSSWGALRIHWGHLPGKTTDPSWHLYTGFFESYWFYYTSYIAPASRHLLGEPYFHFAAWGGIRIPQGSLLLDGEVRISSSTIPPGDSVQEPFNFLKKDALLCFLARIFLSLIARWCFQYSDHSPARTASLFGCQYLCLFQAVSNAFSGPKSLIAVYLLMFPLWTAENLFLTTWPNLFQSILLGSLSFTVKSIYPKSLIVG